MQYVVLQADCHQSGAGWRNGGVGCRAGRGSWSDAVNVSIDRMALFDDTTLGLLSVEGEPVCWTLEDAWRANRISVSCIPDGSYELVPHDSEHFHSVWRVTVGGKDVPGRTGILIHAGNSVDDTLGCILVGARWMQDGLARARISDSQHALERLRVLLRRADGQQHELHIKSRRAGW